MLPASLPRKRSSLRKKPAPNTPRLLPGSLSLQCYYWYKKTKEDFPGSHMGGFTRLLHT